MDISKIGCAVVGVWLCALGGVGEAARAGIVWDESTTGDLADLNRYGHPDPAQRGSFTDLGTLTPGVSRVIGQSIRSLSGGTIDGDAVRVVVPAGAMLTDVIFTHDRGAGLREIFRLTGGGAAGPYFMSRTYPPLQLASGQQNLAAMFGPGEGFDPGAYVFSWENAASGTTMRYTVDFVVVPGPGVGVAVMGGCAALMGRRRRAV